MHAYIHTYIHTYIHACMHAYTHGGRAIRLLSFGMRSICSRSFRPRSVVPPADHAVVSTNKEINENCARMIRDEFRVHPAGLIQTCVPAG